MLRSIRIQVVGMLLLLATAATAAGDGPLGECYERASTRLEVGPCLQKKLAQAEESLRLAYAAGTEELRELGRVTGRPDALKQYEAARKEFSRFREANCRWYRLQAEPGTGAGDIELDCLVRMTNARRAELAEKFPTAKQSGGSPDGS